MSQHEPVKRQRERRKRSENCGQRLLNSYAMQMYNAGDKNNIAQYKENEE